MRLALIPITSFRHLKGESEIVMFTNQIRQWVNNHPDMWLYFILPRDCIDQGWEGIDWPRCTVLWEDELGLYYDKLADIPNSFMQLFNMRNGQYQIDGLITSRRAAAIRYAREAWDHRLKKTFPVFIDESMVADFGKTPSAVQEIETLAQTLGYAVGWPIWDTEVQKANAINAARRYLAGAQILKAFDRGVVIPCGFYPERVDRILGETAGAKEEKFTCFFGGRLNRGSKRADVMLREYDSLFRFGREMDITICSPKEEGWIMEMIAKDYPEMNVLVHTPSDEFVQRASRAHVFFNTSRSEGFSVGFCEMMYMTKYGTVLIAPRMDWVAGMFGPKYDDYPFLYEDFDQARTMLRWVYDNYEEAVAMVQKVDIAGYVAEHYNADDTAEAHWQHMKKVTDAELTKDFVRGLMSSSNRELAEQVFADMPNEFDIDTFYAEMVAQSRAMKSDPRRGQTTKWAVRQWLTLENLAVDKYDGPIAAFRKS